MSATINPPAVSDARRALVHASCGRDASRCGSFAMPTSAACPAPSSPWDASEPSTYLAGLARCGRGSYRTRVQLPPQTSLCPLQPFGPARPRVSVSPSTDQL